MGSRGRQGDPGGCREACLLVLEVFEGPSRLPLSPTRRPVPTHSWPPLPLSPSGPRPGRGPLLPPLPRLLAARSPRCLTMEPRSSPREPLLRTEPGEDYQAVAHADPRQVEKDYYRSLRSRRLFVAALAAVLGNFSFGFALVYPSPVIPALERSQVRSLQLSEAAASWFGSVFTLGVAAGGLGTMYFNDCWGRKLSIMTSAVPSAFGYLLMGSAQEVWMLLVGRLLTGFAGGVTSASIPVYISEISYPGIRGALGSCPQIMAVLGALTLYSLGLVLPWRWLAVAGEVPVLLMIILLCFMPDSPRFLISKRKDDEALSALTWLRGQDTDYQWEYEQIKDSVKEQSKPITWAELKTPYIYKPVGITLLMRFLQQLSGITPILVYLQLIFDSTAVILAPQYDAVLVGAVRLVSVIVAASSMDKAGRKILLYISAVIMFASSLTLGLYIHYVPLHRNTSTTAVNSSHESLVPHPANGLTILPLIATMFFIIGYAVGWGPITWLLMGEVLPLKARGMVSGLCVLVSWLTAFALTKAFLRVKEAFGLEVPFFFFSIICVINLIFTKWLIPETKGRSLERIESYFRTGRKSFLESLRRHR
ncbi:solute carrier family 2, facilitated glucose transporter member 6 isoform X1 [Sphaerodactylus townsendi]|uniref:solute carrier family 2, facilitated glucose transporter member 6 isoform X1 n=1 Tax=Sphaerodactylus townsendi TaxID=933632 RepID=UPI0020272217|nr:solute carrier family 2, facilitated glucose transporter member 6 isoform X1 [Sphaerodactylus townsendi]